MTATSPRLNAPHAHPTPGLWRRLLAPAIEPSVFDFWAGMVNPIWSWSRPLARIVARRVEAADTVTLVLKPNAHVGSFQPGQHVNVSAEVNGRKVTRSYSLTGLPSGRRRRLSITVKRVEGGTLSSHLVQHARVGDVLEIGPAFGDMVLPAQLAGRWLFLAAGSGITPLMSLTRALAARKMPVELTLIYWAKTRAELCFIDELRALAAREPRFHLHVVLTHETERLADEHEGLISLAQLEALVPSLAEQQVYACGPGGFVEAARQLTQGRVRQFQAEGFTPAALPPETDTAPTRLVNVHLARSGRTVQVSTGTSLLEALEAQGLNPPSGCRMGICHTCVCPRHSGSTLDTQTGETQSEPDMAVRLCVSRARSDLSLEL
ncbi:ferredoxin reductase [Aquabacterium fontiphilum]|uniref:ferredoxin reductase n=1 Tax=Aquabacterium fontiphilum TaxID=450365 RepID=UPI00191C1A01